jgi:hypothetical protein
LPPWDIIVSLQDEIVTHEDRYVHMVGLNLTLGREGSTRRARGRSPVDPAAVRTPRIQPTDIPAEDDTTTTDHQGGTKAMTTITTAQSLRAGPEHDRSAEEPCAAGPTRTERSRRRSSAIRRVVVAAAVPVALATAQPAYAGLIDAPLGSVPIAGSPAPTDAGAAPGAAASGVPSLANLPGVGGLTSQNTPASTPTAPPSPPATPAGLPANPTSTSSCTQTPSTATNSCSQTAPAASSNPAS